MRIGFDAFPMQKNPSGIGKYVINVLEEIIGQIPDANYFAYSNREIILPNTIESKINKRQFVNGWQSKLPGKVWLKMFEGNAVKKDQLDVYISSTGFFPKLPASVKRIAIVHDLNAKLVPKTMGKMHYLTHLLFYKKDIRSADFIISNSNGTAEKADLYYGKKTNLIINPPISPYYHRRSEEQVNKVISKYRINSKYILFVGNLEPRKNLEFVLNNFIELLKDKKITNTNLVVVGLKGWRDEKIQLLLEKYSANITTLGYVDEADLPALYSGAKLFVFPSFYEGFGIPIREALLCGTPVVTSDITELREAGSIAKDPKMISYINPTDSATFKSEVLKYLNDDTSFEQIQNQKISIANLIQYLRGL